LDVPLDPHLFGDSSNIQRGNVARKVNMRITVFDERTLRQIETRRKGLRTLLTKFTFALADNMRWMPSEARGLFVSELTRLNEEGQKLIGDLLTGDVTEFINVKRAALVADINAMYTALGKPGQVSEHAMDAIVDSLTKRLEKAKTANFMPKLSFSVISFVSLDSDVASPWGQAFSLLADIAAFPRKALTDTFFFRGLEIAEDDLIEAMNVADDALCRNLRARGIKQRCKQELDLLTRIEEAHVQARERCELVLRLLNGDPVQIIDDVIASKKAEAA
jgi:hypothetical protein